MTRSTKIRNSIATLATAAVALTALTGTAFGATDTKVTIKGENGDFYGYVKSADPDCASERKVVLFRNGEKIGSDISEATNGNKSMWSTGNSGYKTGDFYAKAKKTSDCKAATSKTLSF